MWIAAATWTDLTGKQYPSILLKGTDMKAKKTTKQVKAKKGYAYEYTPQATSPSVMKVVAHHTPSEVSLGYGSSNWIGFSAIKTPGLYVMRNSNNGEVCYSIARILGIDRGYGQFFRVEGVHSCISTNSTYQAIVE